MKKILSILTIVAVTMCAFSFVSCSNDDDDNLSTADVVGIWMTTSVQIDGKWVDLTSSLYESQRAYANFKSDGTYVGWGSLGNGSGTWKLEGRTLTTYVSGKVYITYSNIVLNGSEMSGTMSQGSTSMNFKAKKQ